MSRTYTLSGPAFLAIAGAAMAGEIPVFDELDRDGDGRLSHNEYAVVEGQLGGLHEDSL